MTLDGFFDILRREQVPYVVLRWFEELPDVEPGHDIDMLVDDEHVDFVQSLLADRPPKKGSQHLDVYSGSGLPGSNVHGTPCFPPRFAGQMLADGVWLRDRYRVPEPRSHFLGLAYHAVYHKGYSSGLRSGGGGNEVGRPARHDYEAVLADMADRLGESVDPTLDGLDRYLAEQGLRPSTEMLRLLAPTNPWLEERLREGLPGVDHR
jgi:hypothetical protein